MNELTINGTIYVPKNENQLAEKIDDMPFVMVRTYSAGVFFGYLSRRESTLAGVEVTLLQARRVYYWAGAMTLSQLAMEGTSKPDDCKFPLPVNSIDLIAIEIIPITEVAEKSLNNVKIWKM